MSSEIEITRGIGFQDFSHPDGRTARVTYGQGIEPGICKVFLKHNGRTVLVGAGRKIPRLPTFARAFLVASEFVVSGKLPDEGDC